MPQERLTAELGDCSLLVIWRTSAACPRPVSGAAACPLLSYRPYRSRPGLAALTASRLLAEANGTAVQAQLCGVTASANAPCGGAPLCVTDSSRHDGQPVPIGSPDRPARLTAVNGSVTLTYGQPGEGMSLAYSE